MSFFTGKEPQQGFRFTERTKKVTIPIEVYHNLILVPIRINGSFEMNFILDTGSKTTLLTEPRVLDLLNVDLTNARKQKIKGLGEDGVFEASIVDKVTLSLPGIEGCNMRMVVLPYGLVSFSELLGKQVMGIIGYDFFKNFIVEINYDERILSIYKPEKFKYRRSRYTSFPIDMVNSKPYMDIGVLGPDGEKVKTSLLLDTGNGQAISLSKEIVALPDKTIDTYVGRGLSGDIFGKLGKINGLRMGGIEVGSMIACYPDDSSLNLPRADTWQGSIGGELLKRFHLIIDYPRKTISFKKNRHYKKPFYYNISGVEMTAKGDHLESYYINHIRENSPADRAGLKIGDKLLRVNALYTKAAEMTDVYMELNRKEGRKVCVRLMRDGEKKKICFLLENDL